jgi:predicted transcriptional regulator
MKRTAQNYRCGEDHQRAKISDEDVELMRILHDLGLKPADIARKFECNFYTVYSILTYRSRYS